MVRPLLALIAGLSVSAGSVAGAPTAAPPHRVASLKVTILSTMLADQGTGE